MLHFIQSVFCLTTGSKPPPKCFRHIVRSRASSFKWEYPILSLRSSSSFLHLLPCTLVTSISPFIFPSITCYTALNQFSLQCTSSSCNSKAISPPTVCIPSSPVWSKAFFSLDAILPEHAHYNTVTICTFHCQTLQSAANWLLYKEKNVPHIHCIEEAFLSCGPQPEVFYNLFHTMWSIKLQQVFLFCRRKAPLAPLYLRRIYRS